MRFEAAALTLLLASSSCGVLGGKEDPPLTLDFPTPLTGCLDNTGSRLTAYLNGTIDPKDWKQGLDCTNDSLKMLNKYGGSAGGYTQENIRSLVQTLVLTDTKLPEDFVQAIFELKASLFGGSKDLLSITEVEQIMSIITVLRDESLKLLPLLKARVKDGGPANQLAFSRAVALANSRVGLAFPKQGPTSAPLTKETTRTLFRDMGTILKWNIPAYLTDVLLAAKVVLLGGSPEAIEAETWQVGFETLGAIAAPAVALIAVDKSKITGPNGYGEYLLTISTDLESALEKSIEKRGGLIPAQDMDRLINAIPENVIPIDVSIPTLLKTVHAATGKLLRSAEAGGLDRPALQRALQILGRWQRGKTYIDSIYAQQNLDASGVTQAELLGAINDYKATAAPASQADLDRLATLVTSYRPLFMGEEDGEISLAQETFYTKNHLTQMHWINLVAELAVQSYSSEPGKTFLVLEDLQEVYDDFAALGADLDVVDPSVPNFAGRRFREADFYMPNSDGNGEMTLEESTYYIAYIKSIGANAKRIRADTEEACKLSDVRGPMGWKPQDPNCFRSHYFGGVSSWWNHAPAMLQYFLSLGKNDTDSIAHDLEHVARLKGYSEEPMGGYDAKAIPAALHYIETLIGRFDRDKNGKFNTDEAVEASQIFTGQIAKSAGLDPYADRDKIEAIFTYVIKHGKRPDPQPLGTIQIAGWLLIRPFWNIDAPRTDLYRTLAVFQSATLQNP